jgi:hypothetical protein
MLRRPVRPPSPDEQRDDGDMSVDPDSFGLPISLFRPATFVSIPLPPALLIVNHRHKRSVVFERCS